MNDEDDEDLMAKALGLEELTDAERHADGCPLCAPLASVGHCLFCDHVGPGPKHLCRGISIKDYCEVHRAERIAVGTPAERIRYLS